MAAALLGPAWTALAGDPAADNNYKASDARGLANYAIPVPPDFPERVRRAQHRNNPCSLPALPPGQAQPAAINANDMPTFDVVRVAQDGLAVFAGRAAANATVKIFDCGREVGHVEADRRGEWVFSPDKALLPGPRQFALREQIPGGAVVDGIEPVVMIVPERPKNKETAEDRVDNNTLALKIAPAGSAEPVKPLQLPTPAKDAGPVSIGWVHHRHDNHMTVSGHAAANAAVQVYLDNKPLGKTAVADKHGSWSVEASTPIKNGRHPIRADEIAANGKVTARAEVGFAIGKAPEPGRVIVAPGENLWQIAVRTYGNGADYIIIYKANKAQIRDPSHLYPGQVLIIPPKPSA